MAELEKSFKINGLQYDSIGTLNINGQIFLVTKNGDHMILVQAEQNNNEYSYSIPQKDENNPSHYKGIAFAEQIVDSIKHEIESGEITTKEDLQKRIQKADQTINSNQTIKDALGNQGLDQFKAQFKELYDYFDKLVKDDPSLNMEGITAFKTNNEDNINYIKQYDSTTGETHVLVNESDKNFVDEFKQKQNELASANTEDSLANAQNVFDMMKDHEKVELNMNSLNSTKPSDINGTGKEAMDNAKELNAMKQSVAVAGNNNDFIADPNSDIYINTTTGETYTAAVQDGKVAIGKVNEQEGVVADSTYVNPETGQEEETYTTPDGTDPNDLPYDVVEEIMNRDPNINEKQRNYLLAIIAKKKAEALKQQTEEKQHDIEQPPKILKLEPPKNSAAYVNLIALCLFVQVFMLLVIVGAILFMK